MPVTPPVPPRRRGAPFRTASPSTVRIEVHISAEERDALRQVAAETGRPMTAIVREAVNVFTSDYGGDAVFLELSNRRAPTDPE
jgi:uncharacterized protein (DUF1778 family)